MTARPNRRSGRKKQRNALVSLATTAVWALFFGFLLPLGPFPTTNLVDMPPKLSAPTVPNRRPVSDSGGPAKFLLGIFTKDNEHVRRALIRRTYLNVTDRRFCSLAQYVREATSSGSSRQQCRVMYAFVVGRSDLDDDINRRGENFANEIDSLLMANLTSPFGDEPDVVHLDIMENMNRGKTPTWFRLGGLLSDAYGIDYVAKADSDLIISVPRLIRLVEEYLPPQRIASGSGVRPGIPRSYPIYGGSFISMTWPRCGFHDCSGVIYMGGSFYFASFDVVRHVLSQNWTIRFEDYDFGRRVGTYPGPVYFMELNSDMFWRHPIKEEETFLRIWLDGEKKPGSYAKWRQWPGVEDQPPPDINVEHAAFEQEREELKT